MLSFADSAASNGADSAVSSKVDSTVRQFAKLRRSVNQITLTKRRESYVVRSLSFSAE